METSTIWVAGDIAKQLGIAGNEFPCRIMEIKQLIYEILKDGRPRDIIVLPFFRNYTDVLQHIRERGILGPVIIYTQGETMFMNLVDMASQGVIFMDSSRFSKPIMIGFLTFMQKSQEVTGLPSEAEEKKPRAFTKPTDNVEEIKQLFRLIMRKRSRLLVTCQFREDLPTLTVTCEIIQMVGEVETRLVLDKFNPGEFVGLYKQMAKGKPITGFITRDEETLGFEFEVVHTVMGKITTLLPKSVYEHRRKFFRVEPDAKDPVMIYILPLDSPTQAFSVRDVSEGGLGLSASFSALNLDTIYPIALALPNTKLILGSIKIMFKETIKGDLHNYGMTLILHESDLIPVRQYVYKRQAGILAAIRDLTL
jgi:hypothetical protein